MWHCVCECGKECDVRASDLKSGNTTSCGCQSSKVRSVGLEDLTDRIFGDFKVMYRSPNKITPSGQQTRVWHCMCIKCGIEKDIQASQLKKWSGECECTKLLHKQETEQKKLDAKIEKQKAVETRKELRKVKELEKAKKAELKYISQFTKKELLNKQEKTQSKEYKKVSTVNNYKKLNEELLNNWKVSYPELFSEWDISKNELIMNNRISAKTKAWWLCPIGHSYDMRISSRISQNCGCPYCSVPAKRILVGFNDLATKYPQCLKEWDYEKNEVLPTDVFPVSAKKVWWICEKGHSFQQSISYKTSNSDRNSTCPYCSHQKLLTGFSDIATTHPYILEEWDYEKNTVLPTEIGVGTHHKIWWKCPFGHSYQAYPSNRCGKTHSGCPICDKENHTSFPEQAVFFYIKKYFPDAINSNKTRIGMEVDIYIPSIDIAIEYDGKTWHNNNSYEVNKNQVCKENGLVLIRIREEGLKVYDDCICLVRNNVRNNSSLTTVIKDLLKTIDNIDADIDVERDSALIYSSYIETRKQKSLASNYPEIAKEWHPTKNGQLTPMMVAPIANKVVWWLGECGHEYQMEVGNRTNQNCGCPYCSGKRILIGFNDFETWCKNNNEQHLLDEWDFSKNTLLPSEVTKSSDKLIYWKCSRCSNVWRTKVDSRTRMNSGCPKCASYFRNIKPIINIDTNVKYESILKASEELNISRTCIANVCRGTQKSAGGYRWMFYEEYIKSTPEEIQNRKQKNNNKNYVRKKVFCVETNKTYNSISDACRDTGICISGITNCCKGKLKTAGKKHWKYVD